MKSKKQEIIFVSLFFVLFLFLFYLILSSSVERRNRMHKKSFEEKMVKIKKIEKQVDELKKEASLFKTLETSKKTVKENQVKIKKLEEILSSKK